MQNKPKLHSHVPCSDLANILKELRVFPPKKRMQYENEEENEEETESADGRKKYAKFLKEQGFTGKVSAVPAALREHYWSIKFGGLEDVHNERGSLMVPCRDSKNHGPFIGFLRSAMRSIRDQNLFRKTAPEVDLALSALEKRVARHARILLEKPSLYDRLMEMGINIDYTLADSLKAGAHQATAKRGADTDEEMLKYLEEHQEDLRESLCRRLQWRKEELQGP